MISHPLSHAEHFGSISSQISPTIGATRTKSHPPVKNYFGYIFVPTSINAMLQRSISFMREIVAKFAFISDQGLQDTVAITPNFKLNYLKGFIAWIKILCFSRFQNLPLRCVSLEAPFIVSLPKVRSKRSRFVASVGSVQRLLSASLITNNATIANRW